MIKARTATFGFDEEARPTACITKVERTEKGILFSITIENTCYIFQAPIVGEHNALNISAAILMAKHVGMNMQEISDRVVSLTAEHGIIQVYQYGAVTVIDDTYNSNPTGFRAALGVMNFYPGERRRIVVTRGMIELGELSDEKHEEIGGEIAFTADELIIISPDSADALERGAVTKYGIVVKRICAPADLLQYLRTIKETNAVLLCENRLPQIVAEEIHS
jgi:UDP-N-acetylmuramoyl-tripeptide--D-alanyl-D-alanine ligase